MMSIPRVVASLVVAALLTGTFPTSASAQNRYDPRDRNDRNDRQDQRDHREHGDRRGREDRRDWNNGRRSGELITIYEHANYRGRSMSFNRAIHNLQSAGMNDITSSMQLRGAWIVCEHADFRGRCELVQDNVRDLHRTGLNDRISSLRPADRRDYGR